ncbi:MAG: hypothetical protein QXU18_05575 [Thermoplasmatales archaeon]
MGASIFTSLKALISYLKFNNVVVRLGINIKNENLNAENDGILNSNEQAKIPEKATPREIVSIFLMAFLGIRLEVLGSIDGIDDL